MAKSQETYNKKEKEKKRLKKRQDKAQKREDRKASSEGGGLENMMAYLDENGNITDTPPDPTKKKKVDASSIDVSVPKKGKEERQSVRKGKVDFFNDAKGFGFISESDSNERFFVHATGLVDDIRENDKVSFELEQGMKGLNAVNVKKI